MASDVFFSTNPADFPRLEGLYVSERNPPGFIRGADLSTVGMGGVTVRGPAGPQTITSTARLLEVYGGRDRGSGGPLVSQVWAALLNKPMGTLVVNRVIAVDAVIASLSPETAVDGTGAAIVRIDAANAGAWGGDISVKVEDASDGDANHFNLRVTYLGAETVYENLNTFTATDDNLAEVVGDDLATLITITKLADGRPVNFSTITEADWITKDNADDSMNLGVTLTAYVSVAGSDGTAVAADYNSVLSTLANTEGVSIVMMAGASVDQNSLNATIVAEAALASDRIFLTWAGTHGQSVAVETANLDTDITTRSDRIVWCFNSPYTLDPDTALKIQRPPHEFMAAILTNNDVDIHPGARSASDQLAGITHLTKQDLTRADLISLRDAGICQLEKLPGLFTFRSARTTDLTTGKEEITRRRSADFLQLSAADKLREFVKAKNTIEARAQIAGLLVGFSQSLRDQSRIVENFAIDQESVNTDGQRAQGIEKVLWRVRLIGHILSLVLETEIGTGVVIEA
jgi:hypothetical protein